MTPSQTVRLLAIVQAATPAMKMTELTPEVWHQLLADVPFEAAQAAVYRHTKTSSAYLAPADIRRLVAASAGLLPPSLEEALQLARGWATERANECWPPNPGKKWRIVLDDLPPVVAEVCRLLGSSFIAESPAGVMQKRFAAAYADVCDRTVSDVLASDLGARLALVDAVTPQQRQVETA